MMGKKIRDPKNVESTHAEVDGIGLLDIETLFDETKTMCHVEAETVPGSLFHGTGERGEKKLKGYEIHMGRSFGDLGLFRVRRLAVQGNEPGEGDVLDGSTKGNCWGTYLHGIFENDAFRREVLNRLRKTKGLAPLPASLSYGQLQEQALDRLAAMVRENIDMTYVRRLLAL